MGRPANAPAAKEQADTKLDNVRRAKDGGMAGEAREVQKRRESTWKVFLSYGTY